MKWNSFALNLVLAATVVVACPSTGISQTPVQNSEARRLFSEGVAFHYEGSFVEAEKKFREALTKYPKAEQSDRTAYYLIDTLVRLRRVQDARTEIEQFRKNYPQSKWQLDVDERILTLGGQPGAPQAGIWNSPAELREAQARADLLRGATTPPGPPNKIYADDFPPNASMRAELLRQIVQRDTDRGIENAKEMLKTDPSDPAVVANLGTIANSDSPQALPFLLSIWANVASSPNMRNSAFFWASRRNPDKEQVAKAIMDLLANRETQAVASEALYRMTVADHRAVLEKIVMSSNPEKFVLMEKIYRNGSVLLRTDLLMFIARLDDPKAVPFIVEAAQNERDASVRRVAVQALGGRKDVDTDMLEKLMKAPPPAPRAPQPVRLPEVPRAGSGVPPFNSVP
jgi:tetratricopeptide (TPR) repeat protein